VDNQSIVTIKPKKQQVELLYLVFFLIFPAAIYYFFRQTKQEALYWIIVGLLIFCLILFVFILTIKGKNILDFLTVKLTPQGFYRGDKLYRWHDIDYFGVKREISTLGSLFYKRRVIYWNYKPSSIVSQSGGKMNRLMLGYDDRLRDVYEINSDDLAKLLNEWKIRYTGQPSEIETKT